MVMAMAWDDAFSRRFKFKDLQMLMAVIETGGIGKAADRLNYSQPAVSKAIASLERAFGKRLLDRNRQRVEPTVYGQALLKCGAAIFDDLRKGHADIEFLSDPTAGEVRVGCTEPVSAGFMSKVIDRIVRRHRRITYHVAVSHPRAICQSLAKRDLDFAITQLVDPVDDGQFLVEHLYDDPVVIVAGSRHPRASKRRIKLAELADERWVLPPGDSLIRSFLEDAFRAEGLRPPPTALATHSAYWRIQLAASGHFLTVVPAVMLKGEIRRMPVKVLPVELQGNRRPVALVTLKNRALSPVAQLFIEQARAMAKTMAKD
jgi:DNA-binding transcriptional LysR family regulator